MSEEKDLFDLFRESQHKLEEMPGGQVWQRLETKLDQRRKPRQRRILFLPMSIAAAILVVLVFGSLVAIMVMEFSKKGGETLSQKESPALPNDTIETIAAETGTDTMSIVPGAGPRPSRREEVIAAVDDASSPGETYTPMKSESRQDYEVMEDLREIDKPTAGTTKEIPSGNRADSKEPVIAATDLDNTRDFKKLATEEAVKKPARAKAEKNKEAMPAATAPASAAGPADYALPVPTELMDKLKGTWQSVGGDSNNFEEWVQTDATTWTGRGYMIVNGDTTTVENMSIGMKGDSTYYIGRLDPFGDYFQLRLTGYDDHKAIFGEDDIPVAVTIELAKDGTMTTTINAEPEVLQQNQYLSKRNSVKKDKATRKMKKIRG